MSQELLQKFKAEFQKQGLFLNEVTINGCPCVTGNRKSFKWYLLTQYNMFIVVGYSSKPIDRNTIHQFTETAFQFAGEHHQGLPRGFMAMVSCIAVLIGDSVSTEAVTYCTQLQSGKKWAGAAVPVIIDTAKNSTHYYQVVPMWGAAMYPPMKKLIKQIILPIAGTR